MDLKEAVILCFATAFMLQNVGAQTKGPPPKPPPKPTKASVYQRTASSENELQRIPETSDRKEQSMEQFRRRLVDLDGSVRQYEKLRSNVQKGLPPKPPPKPAKRNASNKNQQQPIPLAEQQRRTDFEYQKSLSDYEGYARQSEEQRSELCSEVKAADVTQKQGGSSPERPPKSSKIVALQRRIVESSNFASQEQSAEQQQQQQMQFRAYELREFEKTESKENEPAEVNPEQKSDIRDNLHRQKKWEIIDGYVAQAKQAAASGEMEQDGARKMDELVSEDKFPISKVEQSEIAPGGSGLTGISFGDPENTDTASGIAMAKVARRQKIADAKKQLRELVLEEECQEVNETEVQRNPNIYYCYIGRF